MKDHLKADLENVLLLEEIKWRQSSRVTWLREGDKNTKFFHRVANSNRRFNIIDHLVVMGWKLRINLRLVMVWSSSIKGFSQIMRLEDLC